MRGRDTTNVTLVPGPASMIDGPMGLNMNTTGHAYTSNIKYDMSVQYDYVIPPVDMVTILPQDTDL